MVLATNPLLYDTGYCLDLMWNQVVFPHLDVGVTRRVVMHGHDSKVIRHRLARLFELERWRAGSMKLGPSLEAGKEVDNPRREIGA